MHESTIRPSSMVFVTSETQGDIHVFIPDALDENIVREVAFNFSRRVRQPVKVFYDAFRSRYRLCPMPGDRSSAHPTYGTYCFECDASDQLPVYVESPGSTEAGTAGEHIPRPPNSWILYRRAKSRELRPQYPGITASELSTLIANEWKAEPPEVKSYWQDLAQDADRKHKEMYPDYKYTMRRHSSKTTGGDGEVSD